MIECCRFALSCSTICIKLLQFLEIIGSNLLVTNFYKSLKYIYLLVDEICFDNLNEKWVKNGRKDILLCGLHMGTKKRRLN